ncbi:Methyltransferase type 11 [Desulfofundulus kuznetsovii DSM 6115]|uniref:Methyltransferase type 11 n=1 Tax=Desulfofundulus kuznetsovii (strain DSM 6115 / VKM B-1805 / 17) TaxID=760568 RepID=A0AAU8PT49_DESK7|nr:Methyltransferase type 11 [Desulfofundulus kuznetsovii DSM 6115]
MQEIKNWEREWEEKTIETSRVSGNDYWNKRAEDYANYIKTSDFDHGRKIRSIFENVGILKPDFVILDIAAGPGSVSIPFAEAVKKVIAVEPAKEMAKHLIKNAQEKGLQNIEIINKKWEEVNEEEHEKKFDMVICAHASWHFVDIGEQIKRMNKVSRGYCCFAEGVKSDDEYDEMYKKLGINTESLDRFIYLFNILYQKGILANVRIFDVIMRRSINSAINMWELLISKYRESTELDKEIIKKHVDSYSVDGIYERKSKMAVIWWNARELIN